LFQAHYIRGSAFFYSGNYDKAIADYTAAIQLNPNFATAYYARGCAYRKKGEDATAEKDVAQAKALGYDRHAENGVPATAGKLGPALSEPWR
jgi:tetratricopeptide (TPR) repeat protein